MLLGRIELPTSSLPMTRSTTELQQQYRRCGPMRRLGLNVKRLASQLAIWHRAAQRQRAVRRMALAKDAEDKERIKAERLRAAIRDNLRRRKARPLTAAIDKTEDAGLVEEAISES